MERPLAPFPSTFFLKHARWGEAAFWLYLLVLVVCYGISINVADSDLWHHFAHIEYLLRTGTFPVGDTFSYNADHQYVPDHEWGSALIFYWSYLAGGPSILVFEKLIALGLTLALTVRAGLGQRPPTLLVTFFFSLVLLTLLPFFLSTIRSGVFSHIFLALWVLWFQRERNGAPIHYWGYVLTTIAWANMHPGFVTGLMWLGLITVWEFISERQWKQRLLVLVLCFLATFINPFGWELWLGIFRALSISRTAIDEWGPVPWIHPANTLSGYKILLIWTLIIIFSHIRRSGWSKCDYAAIALTLLFGVISLLSVRNTSFFAIVAGGLIPPLFAPEVSLHELTRWKPWLLRLVVRGTLVILPLVLAARLLPASPGIKLTYPPDGYPIGAIAYLRDNGTEGRLLVGFNSGSYALWELRGKMRVSMDGRYLLVYSSKTFEKIQSFFEGKNHWRDALTDPVPDAVLVDLPDPVYPKMLAEPGWTEVYHDETHAVFKPSSVSKSSK
jgi:hypothetical protein